MKRLYTEISATALRGVIRDIRGGSELEAALRLERAVRAVTQRSEGMVHAVCPACRDSKQEILERESLGSSGDPALSCTGRTSERGVDAGTEARICCCNAAGEQLPSDDPECTALQNKCGAGVEHR